MKKLIIPLGRLEEYRNKPGAELYLIKPHGWDVELIPFKSRLALREFNKRAKLAPLVYDLVKKGMAIHRHEREGENA